jgi:SAM-dependent methyltransferase
METVACPLCGSSSNSFYTRGQREFLQCSLCLSVFTHPKDYLSPEAEKAHYLCHNNDPEDLRYQNFVSPVTNAILADFLPEHTGLDFGSGTGSPILKILRDNQYDIKEFDLFFHNDLQALQQKYDYIACSETAEHFKKPYTEFAQLHSLLNPGGKLYIMTDRFDPNRDFGTWFYKTDPTHVFLYHYNAFEYIRQEFGFKELIVQGRLVVLGL